MGRSRLTPDPTVSVADLQKCFESLCQREGTWDIHRLLLSTKECNWKNAPDPTQLSGNISFLCQQLFKICPNGVLSSKKLKSALEKLQIDKKKRINFSKMPDSECWDRLDSHIRASASHFRELKVSGQKYATCMRKASQSEKESIDKVLQFLDLRAGGFDDSQKSQEANPSEAATHVPEEGKINAKAEEEEVSTNANMDLGASAIFDRVLSKQTSDASTPERRLRRKTSMVDAQIVASGSGSVVKLQRQNAQIGFGDLGLDRNEEQELLERMRTDVNLEKPGKKKKKVAKGAPSDAIKKPASNKKAKAKQVAKKPATKSSFRHRKTSEAYHKAVKAALQAGKTKDDAKVAGRQASQKAAREIDVGILVDPDTKKV